MQIVVPSHTQLDVCDHAATAAFIAQPCTEDDPARPLSVYGATKLDY